MAGATQSGAQSRSPAATQVSVHEAETRLSELLRIVDAGAVRAVTRSLLDPRAFLWLLTTPERPRPEVLDELADRDPDLLLSAAQRGPIPAAGGLRPRAIRQPADFLKSHMMSRLPSMAFSIKNREADRMARELAAITGESLTDAVLLALQERLERERRQRPGIGARLRRLAAETSQLPVIDSRPADEILGYDERGLPS